MVRTKYYHVDEVSDLLGLTTDEVRGMLKRNELKGHKKGRRWLIDMNQAYFDNLTIEKETIEIKDTFFRYIKDAEHEEIFRECLYSVKRSLYICTGDFMNIYIEGKPLVSILNNLANNGIEIVVKCMDSHHNDETEQDFKLIVCQRSHMKVFIFDEKILYMGSANITKAALTRNEESRKAFNYEAGILTNDSDFIEQALQHFHSVARIDECINCKKKICNRRICI